MNVLVQSIPYKTALSYLTKILMGTLFITVSAQISIPFYPVPMTLQPMALMTLGLVCAPKLSLTIVGAYIAEAALGLPVLSNMTGGWEHLLGTRGGYIVGFLPLAFLTSFFATLAPSLWTRMLGCVFGNAVLYLMGVTWLTRFVGFEQALHFGLYPFLMQIPLYIAMALTLGVLGQKIKDHLRLMPFFH